MYPQSHLPIQVTDNQAGLTGTLFIALALPFRLPSYLLMSLSNKMDSKVLLTRSNEDNGQ